ncbi:hypothetical protein N0V91_008520 [Didymella pomorum]|uniref:Uncharacterized protein n=1 Tax=Didymella pomorum TaxID=749634 RepID=A0A9W9D5C9_9PLEO|nr:hypothetical protein N0V91_008520 [Didymella pomorum]
MQDDESDWDRMLGRIKKRALHTKSLSTPWPIGFSNIRKVAVGVTSATWMDDNRDGYDVEPCTFLFSHLLRLPSLHSIYFSKLLGATSDYEGELDLDEEECLYDVLPVGSSSVKHIFLHGCSGTFGEDQDELWAGPRQLLTMSFRFAASEEFDYATNAANSLVRVQGGSLQSLMWYGYTDGHKHPRNIVGDHCTILDNEEFNRFKRLPALKQMSVCMNDIELYMEHADTYNYLRSDPEEGRDDEDEEGNIYDEEDHEKFISGRYAKLKAIFLEATEDSSDRDCRTIENSWFQEAVKAGRRFGVDVYTLSNREGMRHSLDFTEAPDEYDLKSGLHAGTRPNDWVFDPYLGHRIPPRSKAERYAALWKNLKSEREALWAAQRMEFANGEDVEMEPWNSLPRTDRE